MVRLKWSKNSFRKVPSGQNLAGLLVINPVKFYPLFFRGVMHGPQKIGEI